MGDERPHNATEHASSSDEGAPVRRGSRRQRSPASRRPPLPAGRDLDVGELRSLVEWFAERPDVWRCHVRHDASRRTFHRIVADDHVTVWLICWMPGHDTGFHDHDGSAGAVAVVDGQIAEQRLQLLEPPATAVYGARDVVDFGPAEIHRVRHFGTAPAITVHAYSPVLTRMGAYVTGSDGRLLRHSLDEQTELRPRPAVLAPE